MVQAEAASPDSLPPWSALQRAAFRLCFVYFGLYVIVTQMLSILLPIPNVDVPELGALWPLRPAITWVARHVFRHQTDLVITGSGSGDKTFDWVEVFCLLVIALVATAVWTWKDRRRQRYDALYKWFHLFLRFAAGATMLAYGIDKAIPLQMPFPYLIRLLEPLGNFSPMGILWASVGASRSYEIFAGCAEILGGLLVLVPRTATLGALICLADITQVFVLNMTYDVPVKLFSFHVILICLFLLGPEAGRLRDFFFRQAAVRASAAPALFRTARANRIALVSQLLFIVFLAASDLYGSLKGWKEYGEGSPRSALYGIWNVEELSIDGQIRPALLSDSSRWRRMIFQIPESVNCQMMDDSFHRFAVKLDTKAASLALSEPDAKEPKGKLAFQRPALDRLLLDGQMDSHNLHVELRRMDHEKLLLVSRGFHWVQEYPFNR